MVKFKEEHSWLVLKVGLAIVYFYFAYQQLAEPNVWEGLVPLWIDNIVPARIMITINAVFEIVATICVLINFKTKWFAGLLALHLFVIVGVVGFNPTGVRDFGLAMASLAVAIKAFDGKA
jgi:uncharacterized membrane protein YphA (DoxX/SURF4 family)